MSASLSRPLAAMLVVVLAALALATWRLGSRSVVRAAGDGAPVMVVADSAERDGAKPSPTIYVIWPGRSTVEAYDSASGSFITYDFVRRTVRTTEAEVR